MSILAWACFKVTMCDLKNPFFGAELEHVN